MALDQIALGAGSDEFIVLLARIFAEGGTVATVPSTSYSMYRYAALMAGATVVDDPAKADLVFVCRPNNPTGELPDIPDVPGQLVIDEAYAQYAGVDALDRVDRGAIVLRTFSKAYGLAGARVGYAIATPELTEVITSRQAPLSVSSLSASLALAAIATPGRRLGADRRTRTPGRRAQRARARAACARTRTSSSSRWTIPRRIVERAAALRRGGAGLRRWAAHQRSRRARRRRAARRAASGAAGRGDAGPALRHRRATAETLMTVRLRIPGEGRVYVQHRRGFLRPHAHSSWPSTAAWTFASRASATSRPGDHHTVEDMMRTFGEALDLALGDRRGPHPLRRGARADGRGVGARGRRPLGPRDGQDLDRARPGNGRARASSRSPRPRGSLCT